VSVDRVSYELAHAISGRVRFRVARIAADPSYLHRLIALAEAEAGITHVRATPASASIVIVYRPGAATEAEIHARLVAIIQSAANPAIAIAAIARPSLPSIWRRLGPAAVSAGLAVLGGPVGLAIPAPIIAGAVVVAAAPITRRAIHSLAVERRLNIDVLDFLAVTLTTLQGTFLVPAVTITLVELGEAIRERTARASRREALDLLDSLAQFAWVERDGEQQEVPMDEVRRGDMVIVYPGDLIPVDGRVLEGRALIGEQQLTGEATPVVRERGQTVYASTLVQEGQIRIRAELVGIETRAGQIMRVMQEAPVHDTRIENYAARIADRAVLPTLLLSGAVLAATRNPNRAASVLITDFATGIRVSVPTTVLAALTAATRRGVLIRSGRALEQLGKVDTVVFDKTGTVTQGKPAVADVVSARAAIAPSRVLGLAAAAEQHLAHPAAEAVVRYAREREVEFLPCEEWDYRVGLGVRARIGGQTTLVGSDRLLHMEGVDLDRFYESHPHIRAGSHSVIYVASNGELQGTLAYTDPLRTEAGAVLSALRASGVDVHLLTGDNPRIAAAVARELVHCQDDFDG
jgi:Cu2+-exporting ATPase